MSSLSNEFADAEIGVFWDIVDCPIPEDLCPKSIFLKIKSALENIGYFGKISISAYSDMDQNPEDFESTGITLLPTGNGRARVNTILEDFLLWAADRKRIPFNLLIISEEITEDLLYVKSLVFLKDRTGNILLAQPENLARDYLSKFLLRHVTAVWLWKSLSYGGKPIFNRGSSHTYSWNKSSSLTNKGTCSLSRRPPNLSRPIQALWDWENCGIPKWYGDPGRMIDMIASVLFKLNYDLVRIDGYGHPSSLGASNYLKLQNRGIVLHDVIPLTQEQKERGEADMEIRQAMISWMMSHNPPAPVILITSDRDYVKTIRLMKERGFEVFVAFIPNDSNAELKNAGHKGWSWYRLLQGKTPYY